MADEAVAKPGGSVSATRKNWRVGDGTPSPSKPKGSLNKTSRRMREVIVGVFEKAGGTTWLAEFLKKLADKHPVEFAKLLIKLLDLLFPRDASPVSID